MDALPSTATEERVLEIIFCCNVRFGTFTKLVQSTSGYQLTTPPPHNSHCSLAIAWLTFHLVQRRVEKFKENRSNHIVSSITLWVTKFSPLGLTQIILDYLTMYKLFNCTRIQREWRCHRYSVCLSATVPQKSGMVVFVTGQQSESRDGIKSSRSSLAKAVDQGQPGKREILTKEKKKNLNH